MISTSELSFSVDGRMRSGPHGSDTRAIGGQILRTIRALGERDDVQRRAFLVLHSSQAESTEAYQAAHIPPFRVKQSCPTLNDDARALSVMMGIDRLYSRAAEGRSMECSQKIVACVGR